MTDRDNPRQAAGEGDAPAELLPAWDVPVQPDRSLPAAGTEDIPVAPLIDVGDLSLESIPEAIPVAPPAELPGEPPAAGLPLSEVQQCSVCHAPRIADAPFCANCGFVFPLGALAEASTISGKPDVLPTQWIRGRYELKERLSNRATVTRFRALDHAIGGDPKPVILLEMPRPQAMTPTSTPGSASQPETRDEIDMDEPEGDEGDTVIFKSSALKASRVWADIAWERAVLERAAHPSFPRVIEFFADVPSGAVGSGIGDQGSGIGDPPSLIPDLGCMESDYLVETHTAGRLLWDAWDDPAVTTRERFEWLTQIAEVLHGLHDAGAIFEGLRPDIVVVTPEGQAVITDLSGLLPIPLPPDAPVQGNLYSAPELFLTREQVDARADLYGFGAMLYALHLGRELTDIDFDRQGVPKPLVLRFPDLHPVLGRIVMKTFVRDRKQRFPSDEGFVTDPTGFQELIETLRRSGPALTNVRLDIAAWSNTGMLRAENEDGFAYYHSNASRQDKVGEWAVIILTDGMGGHEAGEIASAMTIQHLSRLLVTENRVADLVRRSEEQEAFDREACENLIGAALQETNRQVFEAAKGPGQGRPGMGCTVEAVYLDGQRLVVGHIGDSRTYHYTQGRLMQLTRDQTLVNRLIELGQLLPEDAEMHPRRNELQQALGTRPDVEPAISRAPLRPGDWVIVCSDGLTNHVDDETIKDILQHVDCAEMCARRLVNLANLQGGSDNCTVVAVRCT